MDGPGRGVVGAVLLAAALLRPSPAGAQGLESFSLAMDNHGLAHPATHADRTDWYYTHGTRIELVGGWALPAPASLGLAGLEPCHEGGGDGPCRVTRIRIVQEIYTPRDHYAYDPLRPPGASDRPYAGWLSGTVAVERRSRSRSRALAVEVGVTGSPSLARETYLAIHDLLGTERHRGWEHEIPFEVAGAVTYRDAVRMWALDRPGGASLAWVPWGEATLGTLRTSAEAGLSLRLGWNAPPGAACTGPDSPGPWALAAVGVAGEWVARDLFLDGSLWHDSARTRREPLLGRARLRLVAGWSDIGVELGLTRSTPAFETQEVGHTFGTVGLSLR